MIVHIVGVTSVITLVGETIVDFSSSSLLIMDFTLWRVLKGGHVLKADVILEAEKAKRNEDADLYEQQGFAFAHHLQRMNLMILW